MRLRYKDIAGQQRTVTVEDSATCGQFMAIVAAEMGVKDVSALGLKSGIPPYTKIDTSQSAKALKDVGIKSLDLLIVTSSTPTASKPQPPPQTEKLVKYEVADDNSCLFHAIAFLLLRDEQQASQLRHIAATAIESNPKDYPEVMLGMSSGRYVAKILSPDVWGGAIELAVFARHFEAEIVAIDVEFGTPMVFGEGAAYRRRVYVLYSGIHYDAICLKSSDGHVLQTVFESGDDEIFGKALAIADEERRAHRFTNTNSFTLRCKVCKLALRGQAEAQDHAGKTGHVEFEEYS